MTKLLVSCIIAIVSIIGYVTVTETIIPCLQMRAEGKQVSFTEIHRISRWTMQQELDKKHTAL